MTKKDIVRTISEKEGLTQQQTKKIVQLTFEAIVDSLVRERRIELRNFGVFEVKPRAARKARNPRTGQQVDVPRKYVVTFKPGKEMEEKIRNIGQDESAESLVDSPDASGSPRPSAEPPKNSRPDSPSGRWDTE